MTKLSVNVNKIAVLRNSRGGTEPSVLRAARTCIEAGADGITVHPRPDLRHIRPSDVREIAALCRGRVEFNVEGNPFAPARGAYPGLIELVRATRPDQVTLVPDADGQLTSDHGFVFPRDMGVLRPVVRDLLLYAGRVSVFVDAGADQFQSLAEIGVARIEIYTGPYAAAHASGTWQAALEECVKSARGAEHAGLAVNAGHDLDQGNLPDLLAAIPGLAEVSIGHALVADALYAGLAPTVNAYQALLRDR